MPAGGNGDGVADEIVIAIGRRGWTACAGNDARGAVTELIRDVEIKFLAFETGADAEKMTV